MVLDFTQVKMPFDLGIKVPEDDPVRILSLICDQLNYSLLCKQYNRAWRKFDPKTLFKILLYGYVNGKYSAREIENCCKKDICFMWLLDGLPAPDHSTIARFQNGKLTSAIEDLFYQFVKYLSKQEEIHGNNLFVDGTKIEAYANKYSFVWKKAINKYFSRLSNKISQKLSEIIIRYGFNNDVDLVCAVKMLKQQAELENISFVYGKGKRKTQLQRDIEVLEAYLAKNKEYNRYIEKMGNRPSLSKTDYDATFMHMKEDHMRNGQLKPGYNIQIGVDSEYIVGVGSFPDRNDTNTLIPFLTDIEKKTGNKYSNIVADAGYESEENYDFLKNNGQNAYIKPQNYEISKTKKYKADISKFDNMHYDEKSDVFTCVNGRKLRYIYTARNKTTNGYETKKRYYRCDDCTNCPYREKCFKSQKLESKQIGISLEMMKYRQESLSRITTEDGIKLRVNRSIQVEGAFGVIKENYSFRRFLTRGKRKTQTQFFLIAFAFNVLKYYNKSLNNRLKTELFEVKVC